MCAFAKQHVPTCTVQENVPAQAPGGPLPWGPTAGPHSLCCYVWPSSNELSVTVKTTSSGLPWDNLQCRERRQSQGTPKEITHIAHATDVRHFTSTFRLVLHIVWNCIDKVVGFTPKLISGFWAIAWGKQRATRLLLCLVAQRWSVTKVEVQIKVRMIFNEF